MPSQFSLTRRQPRMFIIGSICNSRPRGPAQSNALSRRPGALCGHGVAHDVAYCAHQMLGAQASLGPKIEAATTRVLQDDMVLPAFKDMLGASQPPIDHRYTVNERGRSSSNAAKNVNVLRDHRSGRAAHNGLVAGSSPAGPTSESIT
jgi:hypothetical protein